MLAESGRRKFEEAFRTFIVRSYSFCFESEEVSADGFDSGLASGLDSDLDSGLESVFDSVFGPDELELVDEEVFL